MFLFSIHILTPSSSPVAAVGLAERVAAERCEPLGGVVGYAVRQDVKRSASTRLLFCTTGVLLRRLLDDPQLAAVTHGARRPRKNDHIFVPLSRTR